MTAYPPSAATRGLFAWLWRGYLRRHWRMLAVAMTFMALEGASLGLFAWLMAPMFDRVLVQGQADALWTVGLTVLAVFLARAFTSMAQRILMVRIAELTAGQLRGDMLAHLMTLDGRFFQDNPPGSLIERVQGDVTAINQIWSGIVTGLGRDLVSVVALFAVALSVDWRWTLVALVGVPLLILPSFILQRFVRARARAAREVAARMATRLDEVFHGITAIKLNRLERYQSDRYRGLIRSRVRAETRSAAGQAALPALIDVMTGFGFLAVLYYGGSQIIAGDKTVGQFMSFFTAMSLTFEPLRRLGNISGMWQSAAASVERIRALLDARPTLADPATTTAPPQGAPEVRLENVTLAYDGMPVLDGVTFTAEAGQTTALVGASGAGKSTVFNVLTRLVDPQAGLALIGSTPTTAMSLSDLRGLFSVVTQDAALFDETIRDNILLGRTDVSDERLAQITGAAHVADFLPQLPLGLDHPAGPRGSALSGGQRQRVAIARALLRDTPILLLDEATSALDTRSESIVQAALDQLSAGRTTLVIAHRLSTVIAADKIVVLDRGRVVDQGRHEELLERGGLYAELYRLQFRDKAEGEQ